MNTKQSIIGSTIALILATSCCWLPALIVALGGASGWMAFSEGVERGSGVFGALGVGLLFYGGYQFYKKRNRKMDENDVVLMSIITCPSCGFEKEEIMPTNACQYFYECEKCATVLRPKEGDCCVFCSFGTVACPPIQLDQNCC